MHRWVEWWRIPGWPEADEWQAWWAFIGVILTIGGLFFAYIQLKESRKLRDKELEPYVVVSVQPGEYSQGWWAEIVIVNLGMTAAFDVRIQATPAFIQVSAPRDWDINESRLMKSGIRLLAPNEPFRFNFDVLNERFKAVRTGDVPGSHKVTVTYRDRRGKAYVERYVLDLMALEGLSWSVRK